MRCTADDYRARAEQCEASAEIVISSSARRDLLELADSWRAMADQLEQRTAAAAERKLA